MGKNWDANFMAQTGEEEASAEDEDRDEITMKEEPEPDREI